MRQFVPADYQKLIIERQQLAQRMAESEDGIPFLAWLKTHVCRVDEAVGETDPVEMGIREGMRRVWFHVLAEINKPTAELVKQMEEFNRQQAAQIRENGDAGQEYHQ
ncbi:MAG: hypothetical protein V3V08_23310 [Nannocystaceae bacterium]